MVVLVLTELTASPLLSTLLRSHLHVKLCVFAFHLAASRPHRPRPSDRIALSLMHGHASLARLAGSVRDGAVQTVCGCRVDAGLLRRPPPPLPAGQAPRVAAQEGRPAPTGRRAQTQGNGPPRLSAAHRPSRLMFCPSHSGEQQQNPNVHFKEARHRPLRWRRGAQPAAEGRAEGSFQGAGDHRAR